MHILTSRDAALLPAPAVIWRMTCRWREENYFRYARAHFALDALDSYAVTPDDPGRRVPNPAKKTASAAVTAANKDLAAAQAAREGKLAAPVDAARRKLDAARAAAKAIPAKIPLSGRSGSGSALPRSRPLRTVRAGCPRHTAQASRVGVAG